MNRMQPCAECGCPVVYHRPPRESSAGPRAMACEECTREKGNGREWVCKDPTA